VRDRIIVSLIRPTGKNKLMRERDQNMDRILESSKGMYKENAGNWNPQKGCKNGCMYCVGSFQRYYRRFWRSYWKPGKTGKGCEMCRDFRPHAHPEELARRSFPDTPQDKFIFVVAGGDIAFAKKAYLDKVAQVMSGFPKINFLVQTKCPRMLFSKACSFSQNVAIDITLETNRDEDYDKISSAELPSKRFQAFLEFRHPRKFVTKEPILKFDKDVIVSWMRRLAPSRIYVGYESKGLAKKFGFPEPALNETTDLTKTLGDECFTVYRKLMRKAWWETP